VKRKLLIELDLSQAEARAVAYYCGDSGLKEGFKQKVDVHCQRAAMIFGYTYETFMERYKSGDPETKLLRQIAKVVVHATNYDASARTINNTLKTNGVFKREGEVKRIISQIHEAFPGIRIYQSGVQQELRRTRVLKTAKGMKRYFYSKLDQNTFRRAYAFLPQCTVAEITNDGLVEMEPQINELGGFVLLQVHDSVLLEIPERHVQEAITIGTKALVQPIEVIPFFGQPDILTIPVDVKVGTHWGELKGV
jgi:DNA polymerase I